METGDFNKYILVLHPCEQMQKESLKKINIQKRKTKTNKHGVDKAQRETEEKAAFTMANHYFNYYVK